MPPRETAPRARLAPRTRRSHASPPPSGHQHDWTTPPPQTPISPPSSPPPRIGTAAAATVAAVQPMPVADPPASRAPAACVCVDAGGPAGASWRVTGQQHAQEFVLECFLRLRSLLSRTTNEGGGREAVAGCAANSAANSTSRENHRTEGAFNQNLFRHSRSSTSFSLVAISFATTPPRRRRSNDKLAASPTRKRAFFSTAGPDPR